MPSSKVTKTVQAFQVDSSFDKIQSHCEATHKQLSRFISNQFDDLLQKGEGNWIVSLDQFSELITKESTQNICRFRLREDVNKRIDAFNMNTSRKKSLFLSFLIYQVAVQLEQGNRQEDCEKRDEKIA